MQKFQQLIDKPDQLSYAPYLIALTDRAREMRKQMTGTEAIFWNLVRGRRFHNFKFVRQKPLLGYIADFYCAEMKIAIEIDGGVHDTTVEYDQVRTDHLQGHGITVIRYSNEDIINNLLWVCEDLLNQLLRQNHRKSP